MLRPPVHDATSLQELRRRREALKDVQSFPYSESLRSVMSGNVFVCSPDSSIKDAVTEMARRGISSVVVVDVDRKPIGILTERDVLNKVVASDGYDLSATPVSEVMTAEPVTMSPDDSIYSCLSVLTSRRIKHLPLTENGEVVGIVTMRQLLKLKYPEPLTLISRVHDARDHMTLRDIKNRLPHLAASKLRMGISANETVVMISLINQDLHRKTLELAIEALGPPPVDFSLFVTGSHGRLENLLVPDQDHAMIISDEGLDDPDVYRYFMELGRLFSEWLTEVGYEFCPGYIMSMNPTWRKHLKEWKIQINYWFERQMRSLFRYATVLFDALPVYGNRVLFREMSDFAHETIKKHFNVLRILHEEEGSHRVPIGLFGRFITEKSGSHRGELNIKRSGLIFVVEGVRIVALLHGIRETSTIGRIRALVEGRHINSDDGEYFEEAYQILLYHALTSQVEKAAAGADVDAYIDLKLLSSREKEMLRHAYKAVSALQGLVASEFGELVI